MVGHGLMTLIGLRTATLDCSCNLPCLLIRDSPQVACNIGNYCGLVTSNLWQRSAASRCPSNDTFGLISGRLPVCQLEENVSPYQKTDVHGLDRGTRSTVWKHALGAIW